MLIFQEKEETTQEQRIKLPKEYICLANKVHTQDAKAALKSYQASQKSLEAQKLAFDNSKERYDLGALNSFDLEQVRIRLLNAKSSLINSKYDFIFKTKVLDYYTGKIIN